MLALHCKMRCRGGSGCVVRHKLAGTYVCARVRVRVRVCVYLYVHTYIYMHKDIHTYINKYRGIYTYIHTFQQTCIRAVLMQNAM